MSLSNLSQSIKQVVHDTMALFRTTQIITQIINTSNSSNTSETSLKDLLHDLLQDREEQNEERCTQLKALQTKARATLQGGLKDQPPTLWEEQTTGLNEPQSWIVKIVLAQKTLNDLNQSIIDCRVESDFLANLYEPDHCVVIPDAAFDDDLDLLNRFRRLTNAYISKINTLLEINKQIAKEDRQGIVNPWLEGSSLRDFGNSALLQPHFDEKEACERKIDLIDLERYNIYWQLSFRQLIHGEQLAHTLLNYLAEEEKKKSFFRYGELQPGQVPTLWSIRLYVVTVSDAFIL
ncbi:hypothetical protein QBC35DRAFT_477429 [Podospora australis]|uniref:Uncharacterized protein n=1 Tax=Podospora australis TaxID=1536484 RepID=A0AAN6WLI8_9PEZI|nr:hypothetical protein QBC35DRAFT_477429 [Podospora australis]